MQCCQHWIQSWATSPHTPLKLVLWQQNLSFCPYCLLWTPHPFQKKKRDTPSFLWYDFHCWTTTVGCTFFLRSSLPFFTVAITMSPTPAAGSLLSHPLIPFTKMIHRFLAPLLSAQLITAPTRRPREIWNFAPKDPSCPCFDILNAAQGQFFFLFHVCETQRAL